MRHIVQISKLAQPMNCVNVWLEIRTGSVHTGDGFIITSYWPGVNYQPGLQPTITVSLLPTAFSPACVNNCKGQLPGMLCTVLYTFQSCYCSIIFYYKLNLFFCFLPYVKSQYYEEGCSMVCYVDINKRYSDLGYLHVLPSCMRESRSVYPPMKKKRVGQSGGRRGQPAQSQNVIQPCRHDTVINC